MAAIPTTTTPDLGPPTNHLNSGAVPSPSAIGSMVSSNTGYDSSQSLLPGQQQRTPQQQARSVKRPRPVKSCTECRKRKLRCDRLCPCSQCQKSTRTCKYAADHDSSNLSEGSDGEGSEVNRPPKKACLPLTSTTPGAAPVESPYPSIKNGDPMSLPGIEEIAARLDRLEKHVMARSPAHTDMSGSRTHRVVAYPETIRDLSSKRGALRTRFFGQNSSRVLLNLVAIP
jgi:hypothetical protein